MPKSESLPSLFAHLLFFKERLERYAPVALYKRTTMNDLHMLLMTKERLWAIRSGRSWQKSDGFDLRFFTSEILFHYFTILLTKTSESLEKQIT